MLFRHAILTTIKTFSKYSACYAVINSQIKFETVSTSYAL